MLFIPGGRATRVTYGSDPKPRLISNDDLIANKDKFFTSNDNLDLIGDAERRATASLSFEAKVFDSVNFFASLDVPAFLISGQPKLANLVIKVVEEEHSGPARPRAPHQHLHRGISWWKWCVTCCATTCLWSSWPPTAPTSRTRA